VELAALGTDTPANLRRVRSFVRRTGRITRAQQLALELLWPRYGLEDSARPLDFAAAFGRMGPTVVEIGFGSGEHLLARAAAEPARNFLGIDVHEPGVGRALREIASQGLTNVRLMCADAADVLLHSVAAGSVDELVVYFPDPWPKKRHHKRRLIQPEFAQLLARALVAGGRLRLATDWADYAAQMRAVLDTTAGLANASADGFCPRPTDRPLTRFELRGQRLGHDVFDLLYERRPP
jgi:tRNA (guanine-N7-)-methyltransferase